MQIQLSPFLLHTWQTYKMTSSTTTTQTTEDFRLLPMPQDCVIMSSLKDESVWDFYVHVTVLHRNKFLYNKTPRCTNFTNLFWHETLHVSDSSSVHHQEFIHCTLSYGICHTGAVLLESCLQTCMTHTIAACTVNKLLMIYRRIVRNMQSFMTKYICEISASSWFYYKEICHDARSHERKKSERVVVLSLWFPGLKLAWLP